jgi:hypothetical protein
MLLPLATRYGYLITKDVPYILGLDSHPAGARTRSLPSFISAPDLMRPMAAIFGTRTCWFNCHPYLEGTSTPLIWDLVYGHSFFGTLHKLLPAVNIHTTAPCFILNEHLHWRRIRRGKWIRLPWICQDNKPFQIYFSMTIWLEILDGHVNVVLWVWGWQPAYIHGRTSIFLE